MSNHKQFLAAKKGSIHAIMVLSCRRGVLATARPIETTGLLGHNGLDIFRGRP